MKLIASLFATFLATISLGGVLSAETAELPRSSPESQGVSSAGIREFIEAADQQVNSIHSFMLVRHGHVISEAWWSPESAEKPHILWSLSKSFTSTAVGLAAEEGKLSIDDTVLKFFPDDAPEKPSVNLKAMRIRDLLTMSTGHQDETSLSKDGNWVRSFLHHPVPHKPGTHFRYNTPATYMLSAIVQKVTGQTVLEYLTPRLFAPLGIETPKWDNSPQGISIGGYGLYLRTEDIAKFGQLYLQKGKWNGKQIISKDWVDKTFGMENRLFPLLGSSWRQRNKFPTAVTQRRTGIKVMVFNFGDADTTLTVVTERMGNSASCCLPKTL